MTLPAISKGMLIKVLTPINISLEPKNAFEFWNMKSVLFEKEDLLLITNLVKINDLIHFTVLFDSHLYELAGIHETDLKDFVFERKLIDFVNI